MITLDQLRTHYKPQILALASQHGGENIRIFGSVARGDQSEESDVDILYSMRSGFGLWEACGMTYALENQLPFKIDCSWDEQLRPEFRDRILHDAVPL